MTRSEPDGERDRSARTIFGMPASTFRRVAPLTALTVVTVGLGIWGLSRMPERDQGATNTLYETLQLFYVNREPADGVPWQLDVARFLAPLVVLYALVVALLTVAHHQLRRVFTRLFARGHVLVVGAGTRGTMVARSLRGSHTVVVVEPEASSGSDSVRETGVAVLIGDARDPAMLRAARAERAAHVVVLTGDDSTNLEVLAALRTVVDTDRPVPLHVAIDSPTLWGELHHLPMQSTQAQRRVEFVSIPDRIAQLLLESALADDLPGGLRQRIVVRGTGPTVPRLTAHLLRSPVVADDAEILLDGDDARENLRILRETDRWVFEHARVRAGDVQEGEHGSGEAVVVFVCGLDDADALGTALALLRRLGDHVHVHVAVTGHGAERTLREAGADVSRLRLVPTGETLFGEQLLHDAAFERIARGMHADYVAQRRARGVTPGQNETLRPWEQLDERYRQSNRRFADGVADVLGELGAELVPLSDREVGDLPVSDDVLEQLAVNEHDRWCRDQLRDGWQPTDGDKDPERKLHPALKPWEALSEADREKDRDAMRALPRILASVGYEIVVPAAGSVTDPRAR